ncbi:MAG: hypothetical protein ACYC6G_11270 [Desulfobaccales bacterium]
MLLKKFLIVLSSSLMINCCASFDSRSRPDYVGLYGSVAKVMNQKVKPMTPPIVFVQDSGVLGQMFPELSKPGENLLGVYWCGMVYLSQEDVSSLVVSHEFSHYLGANERTAEIVTEVCTRQEGTISSSGKKPGEMADLVGIAVGDRGTRAAGVRSTATK